MFRMKQLRVEVDKTHQPSQEQLPPRPEYESLLDCKNLRIY